MFRASHADPPTAPDMPEASAGPVRDHLMPLSVLELELAAPDAGWAAHLADRGISITIDDIGRASVTRSDARQLFTEKREREAHAREHAAEVERQAIEQDQRFRASLGVGLPAAAIPHGMTYGEVVASAELDSQAYRPKTTLIADVLDNSADTLIFHPMHDEE